MNDQPLAPVVTYQDILDALNKAVLDRGPDYIYTSPFQAKDEEPEDEESCFYFDQAGAPSCIVGHVLSQLGVAPFDFDSEINGYGTSALIDHHVIECTGDMMCPISDDIDGDLQMSTRAYQLLSSAQDYQDSHTPWGQAVAKAVRDTQRTGSTSASEPATE